MKRRLSLSIGLLLAASLVVASRSNGATASPLIPSDTVYDHDIAVQNFRLWDTCYVQDTVWFRPEVANVGRNSETFDVVIEYYFGDSTRAYMERITVVGLLPGGSFEPNLLEDYRTFTHPGTYVVLCCSASCPSDENPANNGGKERVVVLSGSGVTENDARTASPDAESAMPFAVSIDVAHFRSLVATMKSPVRVFDLGGRNILPEKVSRGIYFLLTDKPRKVIVR